MNAVKSIVMIGSRALMGYSENFLYGVYMIGVLDPLCVQDVKKEIHSRCSGAR